MTAGTRRNGTSKFSPFTRASARHGGREAERYTGRHTSSRGKTARKRRVGMVVPAAAAAATLVAGTAAAYALGSGGQSQAAQLNAALMRPAATAAAATPGAATLSAGKANAASSSLVPVAQATASAGTRAAAKPAPSRKPSATPSATPATPSSAPTTSAPAATQAATPAPTASESAPASATLSCDLNYSLLPQNVTAIVSFLLANGYSDNAAAGIAGNIYQESKGNPESIGSGGGGLIGWTPLPDGFVTGDVSADLNYQLQQILVYNQGWASYLPALNAAATPADAAYIYVTDFERAGIPAAATREASADDVASACGI